MKLSVIIPVKNGESTLEKCLSAINKQTIPAEIIVLDTCSTDKSVEIAIKHNARVINIPEGTFNHGLTRNIGVKHTSNELLYFTVQDAYLVEDKQLEKMAAHFQDVELQAVVGMQAIPNDPNKNPARWFKRISEPVTAYWHFRNGTFSKLSLKEQLQSFASWDDVNAMYRRSALEAIPFIETDFAEDKFWAKDALQAGYKIAFDPSLVVYHYHHYDFKYAFKVEYILNYAYYKNWKIFPALPPFIKPLLALFYKIWKNRTISFSKKMYWTFHSLSGSAGSLLADLTFIVIGKFFGEKALRRSFNFFCKAVPQGKVKEG
jgi:rhamnosyltransferase